MKENKRMERGVSVVSMYSNRTVINKLPSSFRLRGRERVYFPSPHKGGRRTQIIFPFTTTSNPSPFCLRALASINSRIQSMRSSRPLTAK